MNTPNATDVPKGRPALAVKFKPNGEMLTEEEMDQLKQQGVPFPQSNFKKTSKRKYETSKAPGEIIDYHHNHMLATYHTDTTEHYLRPFTLSNTQEREK